MIMAKWPAFARTIGIDYSGAKTPTASLNGLSVYRAEGNPSPAEVPPPPRPRKYRTRKSIAKWLAERLAEEQAGSAKSGFHFDVQGSVAKSTHARPCGVAASRPKAARPISTTPSALPPGSHAPTATAPLRRPEPGAHDRRKGSCKRGGLDFGRGLERNPIMLHRIRPRRSSFGIRLA